MKHWIIPVVLVIATLTLRAGEPACAGTTNAASLGRTPQPDRDPYAKQRPELERLRTEELRRVTDALADPRVRTDLNRLHDLNEAAFKLRWMFTSTEADWDDIEQVLRAKAQVLMLCHSLRDGEYDLKKQLVSAEPQVPVHLIEAGVLPGTDPANVRDPNVRAEYESVLAGHRLKRDKFDRERRLERMVSRSVFGMSLFMRRSELRASERIQRILSEAVPDAHLRDLILSEARRFSGEGRMEN